MMNHNFPLNLLVVPVPIQILHITVVTPGANDQTGAHTNVFSAQNHEGGSKTVCYSK